MHTKHSKNAAIPDWEKESSEVRNERRYGDFEEGYGDFEEFDERNVAIQF